MRKVLIVTLAIVAMAGVANAQILGTDHDLKANDTATGQICVFCHTPHNAAPDVPLWNHTLSGNTFTAYDSATMQAVDNIDWTGGAGSVSALCMSCHDGSIGLGSLINQGTATPNNAATTMGAVPANLGTDLSNDHPVAFTYDAALVTADGELADPTTIGLDLFGAGADQLECGTCHDPHDNTNAPFLVMSNNASALCLTCHVK
jgi:predicted CXXCH cytochrome family protein